MGNITGNSMQANAVVFTAPNVVDYQAITCPEPGPRDVVVRVTHSWISNGTEGSFLRGERIAGDTPYTPGDPWPFPIIAGYQKIGIAEWVGAEVTDIAVGETVFAAMGKVDGMFSPMGGQVSPSVSPRDQIWKIPAGVDPLARRRHDRFVFIEADPRLCAKPQQGRAGRTMEIDAFEVVFQPCKILVGKRHRRQQLLELVDRLAMNLHSL